MSLRSAILTVTLGWATAACSVRTPDLGEVVFACADVCAAEPRDAGVRFDRDYATLLSRATDLGYRLPSSAQQRQQNQLVVGLRDAGIWTELDVFYVFATDGSLEFTGLNWRSPAEHAITREGAVDLIPNLGLRSDGGYLNTHWDAALSASSYRPDDASYGVYVHENAVANSADCGTYSRGQSYLFVQNQPGVGVASLNSTGNEIIYQRDDLSGLTHIQRTSATVLNAWNKGELVKSASVSQNGVPPQPFFIMAGNVAEVATTPIENHTYAMFFAGASLSGREARFNELWVQYLQSL